MRNLSSRWKEKVNSGMDVQYLKYADITLADGTVLNLTSADLWQNGMTFEDSVSSDSSFDIGSAIINTLTLSINNFDGQYSDYDFEGAEVVCYIGLQVSTEGTSELLDSTGETILDTNNETIIVQTSTEIEKIRICTATVIEQPEDETVTIDLTCEDNMRKFDRDYSDSKLVYPATRGQIVRDACDVCGVPLQTYNFENDDYIVQTRPSDDSLTFRQVLQWVAQIGCQWMRCDEYGRLCVKWYDTEKTDAQEIDTTYSFTPQHTDVVITGIQVTEYSDSSDEEPESYVAGTQGYVLAISGNKLIRKGDGQTVASMVAEKCVGMIFRPFESTCLTDVALEAGDAITIEDRNGNLYNTYLTTTTLQPGAGQNIACNAKSATKNSSTRYSQATQAYVTARKMIKAEKTAREKALEEFGKRIDSATGVYTTEEKQEDGSYIYYLHDKPTLAESQAVWKMTSEAWGVSTDGGKTWNGGMTVDGDTIVRILNAVGVNADWINAGAITVKDDNSNVLFQVDMDTKKVVINPDVLIIGNMTLSEKLEKTDESIASARNMTLQLSNDMQTITADSEGNIPNFPTVMTTATVMYGTQDITSDCSFTVTKSDSVTGSWSDATHTYNVTGLSADNGWVDIKATYLVNLSVTKRFTLSKQKQGPQGIQGVGKDGKTTYLHIRYSPVQSPTASQMTTAPDSNTQYIGTYSDFNGTPSTNPSDYTWAKFKGDQGVQGEKGADGKSSYTWMRYATRPDGLDMSDSPDYVKLLDSAGSPILDSTGAQIYTVTQATYLGLATNKDTAVESEDPTDYIWSRFRGVDGYDGKDGVPGRTYKIEPSCSVLKRGADKAISPNFLEFKAYYMDGNEAERHPYSGRFIIEETSDGETWTTIYTSSSDESSVKHYLYTILTDESGQTVTDGNGTTVGIPRDVTNIRCRLYESGGTTNQYDMQSVAVVIDVDALTPLQILELVTQGMQGIYSPDGKNYYINASAIKTGVLEGITILSTQNSDWFKIEESLATGGHGDVVDGVLDLSANYSDGSYRVVLESKTCDLDLRANQIMRLNSTDNMLLTSGGNIKLNSTDNMDLASDKEVCISSAGKMQISCGTGDEISFAYSSVTEVNFIENVCFESPPQFFDLSHVSSGGHLVLASDGATLAYLDSSSKRYKDLGEVFTEDEISKWYGIQPRWAKYKEGRLVETDENNGRYIPMFIAEDVEEYMPEATRHQDGLVEDWNERIMIPAMFAMLKSQKKKIDQQEKLINKLYEHLNLEKEI